MYFLLLCFVESLFCRDHFVIWIYFYRQPPEEIELELEEPDIQHGHAASNQNQLHQIQIDQPADGRQEGAGPANVAAGGGAQVLGEQGLVGGNEAVREVENEALQQQLGDSEAEKSRLQKVNRVA